MAPCGSTTVSTVGGRLPALTACCRYRRLSEKGVNVRRVHARQKELLDGYRPIWRGFRRGPRSAVGCTVVPRQRLALLELVWLRLWQSHAAVKLAWQRRPPQLLREHGLRRDGSIALCRCHCQLRALLRLARAGGIHLLRQRRHRLFRSLGGLRWGCCCC